MQDTLECCPQLVALYLWVDVWMYKTLQNCLSWLSGISRYRTEPASWNEEHHLHAKCPEIVFELLGIRTQAIGLEVDCFACIEEGLLFADGVAESSTAKSDLMCHSCYLILLPSIEMQRGWLVANQWPWRLHVRSTGTEPCITREPLEG